MSANPIWHPEALWDIKAVAACLGVGLTVARVKVAREDFPKPVRHAANDHPRWIAGEVWEYNRQKKSA